MPHVRTVCSGFRYKQQTEFIPYNRREITTGENWKESPDVVILCNFLFFFSSPLSGMSSGSTMENCVSSDPLRVSCVSSDVAMVSWYLGNCTHQ